MRRFASQIPGLRLSRARSDAASGAYTFTVISASYGDSGRIRRRRDILASTHPRVGSVGADFSGTGAGSPEGSTWMQMQEIFYALESEWDLVSRPALVLVVALRKPRRRTNVRRKRT